LNRLLLLLAVEDIQVEQIVDRQVFDRLALDAHDIPLTQAFVELPQRLLLVFRARLGWYPAWRPLARQLVLEPEPARRFPVASLGAVHRAPAPCSSCAHSPLLSRLGEVCLDGADEQHT